MKVTVVDCFDSFTHNLVQLVGALGATPCTITCDRSVGEVERTNPDRIILSPGPGTPDDSGVCPEVIHRFAGKVPILGVCLGHQTLVHSYGGTVGRMERPVHGKTSTITHEGRGILSGLPNPFTATRYHSLAADRTTLPEDLVITAVSVDDGCIMAVSHRDLPLYGLQFHPESIMTPCGRQIVSSFLSGGYVA
jgi:anthranilate synthase component II